jgi:hypothetical protein
MDIEDIKKQKLSAEEQNARRSAKAEGLPAPRPKPVLRLVSPIQNADAARVEGVCANRSNADSSKGGAK